MKNIKFWASTRKDTENFFNALKAHGSEDNLTWTYTPEYSIEEIGWYSDEQMRVTYTKDREYFHSDESDKYKEFFFPIPGNEFVEISELDGQIPKPSKYSNWLVSELDPQSHNKEIQKHSHYKKNVEHLKFIDVYRVLDLYEVTDSAIAHAVKKLLVAGGRGAGKDIAQDIDEAIDSLLRWKEMRVEDEE